MSSCLKSFKQIIEKFKLTKKRPQASEDAGLPPTDLTNLPVNNTPELVAALEQVSHSKAWEISQSSAEFSLISTYKHGLQMSHARLISALYKWGNNDKAWPSLSYLHPSNAAGGNY